MQKYNRSMMSRHSKRTPHGAGGIRCAHSSFDRPWQHRNLSCAPDSVVCSLHSQPLRRTSVLRTEFKSPLFDSPNTKAPQWGALPRDTVRSLIFRPPLAVPEIFRVLPTPQSARFARSHFDELPFFERSSNPLFLIHQTQRHP